MEAGNLDIVKVNWVILVIIFTSYLQFITSPILDKNNNIVIRFETQSYFWPHKIRAPNIWKVLS